jgi:hypothetical protein
MQQIGPGGGGKAPPRARETIEYTCRLLSGYGIELGAETLRQAKFDGAVVRGPGPCCTRRGGPAQTRMHAGFTAATAAHGTHPAPTRRARRCCVHCTTSRCAGSSAGRAARRAASPGCGHSWLRKAWRRARRPPRVRGPIRAARPGWVHEIDWSPAARHLRFAALWQGRPCTAARCHVPPPSAPRIATSLPRLCRAFAGRTLLAHLLAFRGCPPGLAARAAGVHASSRVLLLALAWLVAAAGVFDRAFDRLRLPSELLPLLPPLPQGLCAGPAAAAARAAAEGAADAAAGAAAALRRRSRSRWERAEASAQQALGALGALAARRKALASLLDGRERLTAAILSQQMASQQAAAAAAPVAAGGPPAGARRAPAPPLSPFELLLAVSPRLLARHEAALAEACSLLERQADCARHARIFFAWAGSAILEERAARAAAATSAAAGEGVAAAAGAGAAWPVAPAGGGGGGAGAGCAVSASEVAPLLEQLAGPPGPVAERVLSRVLQQLREAAAAAGLDPRGPGVSPGSWGPGGGTGAPEWGTEEGDGRGGCGGGGACSLPESLQPFVEAAAAAMHQVCKGAGLLPARRLG